MRAAVRHLSVAVLALSTLGAAQTPAPAPATPATGEASFAILLHGLRLGTETVSVSRVGTGWRIVSSGHQNAPIDVQDATFDMTYTADWAPEQLELGATVHGQPMHITSTFSPTAATNNVSEGTKTGTITQPISPHDIVLPSSFYGAYEALAARLSTMHVGDAVSLYVAPEGEVRATLASITPRRIATPGTRLDFREFALTLSTRNTQPLLVWTDTHDRLARVMLPAAALTVARADLATVMAREELVTNSGDSSLFVPMLGFSAGATVTSPAKTAPGRRPVVVLVPGFGPEDRDEAVGGVPIFGLLAGTLAEAGYLVVRYDHRGAGQTGGRPENATLEDYRDDLISVISWVRDRKDADGHRLAVIGYNDGGAVAMLAAQKDDDVKGVALLAVPGTVGRDWVLEQQTRALDALALTPAERAQKVALEQHLIDTTLTGRGWETLPPELSHSADQPIFKSWLLFNPPAVIAKLKQPMLIVAGLADADLPRTHADRLAEAAQGRKRPDNLTTVAVLPDVGHSLTAEAGPTVGPPTLAPAVDTAITGWLHDVFARIK